MSYVITVMGYDPQEPQIDPADAALEVMTLVDRLVEKGHRVSVATVNGLEVREGVDSSDAAL